MLRAVALLLLLGRGAGDSDEGELKPYERALPFKPKFFEPIEPDQALEHIKAANDAGERLPNYFKVNDEMLMLPEVFSKLNPEDVHMDHASDGNTAEETKARETRWWGRLYLDHWPQTIQFLRAHFGEPPPIGKHHFVLAEPRSACEPVLANADALAALGGKAIVIADRGNCTFGTKAKNVLASGGAALVLINNEPGITHVPGPDAHDINLSVSMITQDEGALLRKAIEEMVEDGTTIQGAMVPIHCSSTSKKVAELCRPATTSERAFADSVVVGGVVKVDGDTTAAAPDEKHEFLLATFGTTPRTTGYTTVTAEPLQACQPLRNAEDVAGKAVLVYRGNCKFIDKVEHAHAAGAAMIIVVNHDHTMMRFGVEPRWRGLKIDVPVLMVSAHAGDALSAAEEDEREAHFSFDAAVTQEAWSRVEMLWDRTGWVSERKDGLEALQSERARHVKQHAGWVDRIAAIEEAYESLAHDVKKFNGEL